MLIQFSAKLVVLFPITSSLSALSTILYSNPDTSRMICYSSSLYFTVVPSLDSSNALSKDPSSQKLYRCVKIPVGSVSYWLCAEVSSFREYCEGDGGLCFNKNLNIWSEGWKHWKLNSRSLYLNFFISCRSCWTAWLLVALFSLSFMCLILIALRTVETRRILVAFVRECLPFYMALSVTPPICQDLTYRTCICG